MAHAKISDQNGRLPDSQLAATSTGHRLRLDAAPALGRVSAAARAAGQDFVGIPHWQGTLGTRYTFDLFEHASYVSANWQYTGKIANSTPAGTSAYAPDAYFAPSTSYVGARVGMLFGDVDVSLFADNLTNEDALTPATQLDRKSVV